MDNSLFEGVQGARLRTAILAVVVLLGVFLLVQAVSGFQNMRYIGAGLTATNTINVSGYGEAVAVPDIATFTFTVMSEKLTVAEAQTEATKKINEITAYLGTAGIDKKDIQTTDYSVYPQYEYNDKIVCIRYPCTPGEQTLKGYQVRQTTTVKVRDTAKAGEFLTNVGAKGASEVSGLNFTFDKPELVQDQARDKAIADAKDKADTLAKQLGVRIVRVVSFNESGNYPGPMYYSKAVSMDAAGMGGAPTAPEISIGQNKVTSNVTVTYEIR